MYHGGGALVDFMPREERAIEVGHAGFGAVHEHLEVLEKPHERTVAVHGDRTRQDVMDQMDGP